MGLLGFKSILERDYAIVLGILLFIVIIRVVGMPLAKAVRT